MSVVVIDDRPLLSRESFDFSHDAEFVGSSPVLDQARRRAVADHLPYAGSVTAQDAWALFQSGEAVLIDVRTAEERKFVGHVPETKHVAWMTGLSLSRNPRFVKEL